MNLNLNRTEFKNELQFVACVLRAMVVNNSKQHNIKQIIYEFITPGCTNNETN